MSALTALLILAGVVVGWLALTHTHRPVNGWHLAFLAVMATLAAFLVLPIRGVVVVLPLAALLVLTWVHEFTLLMRQGDEMFPGRFDKPIWALLLIVLPPVGLLTFWLFRKAHWPEPKPVRHGAAHDLS